MTRVRICHFSSVHPADDVRIFHKECKTLASRSDWEVHFVGNGPLDVSDSGVVFHALPLFKGRSRLKRMLLRGWQAYRLARSLNAEIYHFHDPELLPWGLLLKYQGKTVVYDAHEDVPRDILTKAWIPALFRKPCAAITEIVENFVATRMDVVITATPFIRDRFVAVGARSEAINNYPMMGELGAPIVAQVSEVPTVCFTGAISEERGAGQMVEALLPAGVKLQLAGSFSPPSLRERLASMVGWENVLELGQVKRDRLSTIFATSVAGLVLFHPVPNNVNAQPNKLFEYMSAGLPVVASNFPLWRQIIDQVGCGLCVDPLNPEDIAGAIRWLVEHPIEARDMGARGAQAIRLRFNWASEADKLLAQYELLIGAKAKPLKASH